MKTFTSILKKFGIVFFILTVILNIDKSYRFIRHVASSSQILDAVNNIAAPNIDTDGVLNYANEVVNGEASLDQDMADKVQGLLGDTSDYYNEVGSDVVSQINNKIGTSESNKTELEEVTVKYVVDGDTIHVLNSYGEVIKVRFIGVNSPESDTAAGELASDYTKSNLKEGSTVYLQYDTGRYDTHDRTLAYIWLKGDVDVTNSDDIIDYMYNAKILINGYADVMTVEPNVRYEKVFEKLQDVRDSNKR